MDDQTEGISNKTFDDELRDLVMNHKNDELKSIFKTLKPSRLIDDEGMTLAHLSARHGNLIMLDYSAQCGCDLNAKNRNDATPLYLAIEHEKFAAAQLLLEKSQVNVTLADCDGKSALRLLTEKNSVPLELIECFFENLRQSGVDEYTTADILARAGCSILYSLLFVRDSMVTRALLERKYWISQNESTAALEHAWETLDLENLRILTHYGPGAAKRKKDFFRDLYRKIVDNDRSYIVESIVSDLTKWQVDETFLQFLQSVFEKQCKRVLQMFLLYRVDEHALRNSGQNLLAHLFGNPNEGVIELLNDRHFEVNSRGIDGMSALHVAVMNGLVTNVKLLLRLGADPNVKDDRGRTPLLCSNAWLSRPIAEHLLEREISETCHDSQQINENERLAELLLRHGADIQVVDDNERSVIEVFYYLSSMEPILARLAVAEAQGTEIATLIRDKINAKDGYRHFYDKCLKQIKCLKKYCLGARATLLDAFTQTPDKIKLKDRRTIDDVTNYFQKCELHRVFAMPLRIKLEKALMTYKSRCKAAVVISESISMMLDPRHLAMDHIVSFLTYDDLILFQ